VATEHEAGGRCSGDRDSDQAVSRDLQARDETGLEDLEFGGWFGALRHAKALWLEVVSPRA
jgi:hypothetical protein